MRMVSLENALPAMGKTPLRKLMDTSLRARPGKEFRPTSMHLDAPKHLCPVKKWLHLAPSWRMLLKNCLEENVLSIWKVFIKTKSVKDNAPNKMETDTPSNWFFTGYFVFLLFGPVPLSDKTLSILSEKFQNVEKQSRQQLRLEDAWVRQVEWDIGEDRFVPAMYKHGVPTRDKASAAQMAKDDYQFRVKHTRDNLALAQNERALTVKKITEWMLMMNVVDSDEEEEKQHSKGRGRMHWNVLISWKKGKAWTSRRGAQEPDNSAAGPCFLWTGR
jgi:hypothetical protein